MKKFLFILIFCTTFLSADQIKYPLLACPNLEEMTTLLSYKTTKSEEEQQVILDDAIATKGCLVLTPHASIQVEESYSYEILKIFIKDLDNSMYVFRHGISIENDTKKRNKKYD